MKKTYMVILVILAGAIGSGIAISLNSTDRATGNFSREEAAIILSSRFGDSSNKNRLKHELISRRSEYFYAGDIECWKFKPSILAAGYTFAICRFGDGEIAIEEY